jgi:hypothetical protein
MDDKGKFYIGDGVYLSRCPYGWVITANHHLPSAATDKVYLEPKVAQQLVERLVAELNEYTEHGVL